MSSPGLFGRYFWSAGAATPLSLRKSLSSPRNGWRERKAGLPPPHSKSTDCYKTTAVWE